MQLQFANYGIYLNVEGDGLPRQRLDEDLHSSTKPKHQVEGRLLLDVVVLEGAAILELLTSEDEALLVRRDALLVLDLLLHVVDRVARLDVERDRLAGEGLDENLRGAVGSLSGRGVGCSCGRAELGRRGAR